MYGEVLPVQYNFMHILFMQSPEVYHCIMGNNDPNSSKLAIWLGNSDFNSSYLCTYVHGFIILRLLLYRWWYIISISIGQPYFSLATVQVDALFSRLFCNVVDIVQIDLGVNHLKILTYAQKIDDAQQSCVVLIVHFCVVHFGETSSGHILFHLKIWITIYVYIHIPHFNFMLQIYPYIKYWDCSSYSVSVNVCIINDAVFSASGI